MTLDARTKRTLYRLLAGFLAAGAGDAIIQFVNSSTYDWRHLAGALAVAAVLSIEQFLKDTDSTTSSPTVKAVNLALEDQSTFTQGGTPALQATVAPPKVALR